MKNNSNNYRTRNFSYLGNLVRSELILLEWVGMVWLLWTVEPKQSLDLNLGLQISMRLLESNQSMKKKGDALLVNMNNL